MRRAPDPAIAVLGLAALGLGCARPRPVAVPLDDWRPFYWATAPSDSGAFDRAAILVPDPRAGGGRAGLLQLDLAGSGALPYGFPSPDEPSPLLRDVRLHGLLAASQPIRPVRSAAGPPPPERLERLGTLGLPGFGTSLLLIDFRAQRIGTLPSRRGDPPAFLARRRPVPLEEAEDRIMVALPVGPVVLERVLLDTGLSPFPLWVDCPTWRRLTGRDPGDPRLTRYRIGHPRGTLEFVAARTTSPARLGDATLGRLEAVCLTEGPAGAALEAWPFAVGAVLGAAAFGDETLLVLDPRNRRLWAEPAGR